MFSNYPSGGGTDISRIVTYCNDEGGQRLGNLKLIFQNKTCSDHQYGRLVGTKIFFP
jgi:hypothetical protein